MNNCLSYLILFIALVCLAACKQQPTEVHFLTDTNYRQQVQAQLEHRKNTIKRDDLFSHIAQADLTLEQREAMEFLYAYMPLSDLADYDPSFFLKQVNSAFAARDSFAWGRTIPEDIFRHFVLVNRINNEDLDTARMVFFSELKDRIKHLSMTDAALEVNHWCHEKVNYRGTDIRTSSPLALVRTSWGRCGEESTFTTAAMRAVGIPARQCYTPRWAHTDDNHAWVEVWIDGKWHYIGACEPEPELDVAWFTAPAKRAMMVHTNVFGLYNGPEEKNFESNLYAKINLLNNYTQTRKISVTILDTLGKPVQNAQVKFNVYNYAEFYPIAEAITDQQGTAGILTGMGDVFVWANKGDFYGYHKLVVDTNQCVITLNKSGKNPQLYHQSFEMIAPSEQSIKEIAPELVAKNAARLVLEDSIRNAYMGTFISQVAANQFAKSMQLDPEKCWKYLNLAQGNAAEIQSFIASNSTNKDLFPFLDALSIKDLRDTPAAYLSEHLNLGRKNGIKEGTPSDLVAAYILSPRISNELIRPWRSFFGSKFDVSTAKEVQADVTKIVQFVKQHVRINTTDNYYNCPISPQGVYQLKLADKASRNIFFVALCRSAGVAARIEQASGKPQYFENNKWNNVQFESENAGTDLAHLNLINVASNIIKPEYYTHYTLAQFIDGNFVTLDFENSPLLKKLPASLDLQPGYYKLMIGSRANDGSVNVQNQYFQLVANETKSLPITMPILEGKLQVRGIIDMNTRLTLNDGSAKTLKQLSNGKGVLLSFADPDKEPTKHILQDLPAQQNDFNEWGGGVVFLVPNDKLSSAFDASVFQKLPVQTVWGVDQNRQLLQQVSQLLQLNFQNNFPLTLFISNSGGILFVSEGYRIGVGEHIIKTIRMQ